MVRLVFLFVLVFLLTVGGFASGQCIADGNDSEADAVPIGFVQIVSDWVCPDPWGHIAIGENDYLVYLNECGFLGAYKPVFSIGKYDLKIDISKERFSGG